VAASVLPRYGWLSAIHPPAAAGGPGKEADSCSKRAAAVFFIRVLSIFGVSCKERMLWRVQALRVHLTAMAATREGKVDGLVA